MGEGKDFHGGAGRNWGLSPARSASPREGRGEPWWFMQNTVWAAREALDIGT